MTDSSFNWIVPLRRVVITKDVLYRELMWEWLRLVAPVKISHDKSPVVGEAGGPLGGNPTDRYDDVDINSKVLAVWYTDPKDNELSPNHYIRGVAELRHWWQDCFEGKLPTSNSGTTTKDIPEFSFHARLWKGPKRVLAELNAKDDPAKLDQLRPYTWDGGVIGLKPDATHRASKIGLLPGDVLEVPLHVLLYACGQQRFQNVSFNPKGSFFLGTSVHKPGVDKAPQLHDNILAMRYQLIHSLAMANCYHHDPVFDSSFKQSASTIKPEGAGVYARGMPYGSNLTTTPRDDWWLVTNTNALQINKDLPVYLPQHKSLLHLAVGLPLTWGWVCSPFARFWLHYMAVSHRTASGILMPTSALGTSMGSATMTTSRSTNTAMLKTIAALAKEFNGDPLLLHNLTKGDITLPREQAPVADLCEFVFPDKGMPLGRTFSQPDLVHTVPEPPAEGHDVLIDTMCPDAGVVMISAGAGHEFAIVRLNYPDRLRERAIDALAAGERREDIFMPVAGELSAYCPLSGVDRFSYATPPAEKAEQKPSRDAGQYFVDESSAQLLPHKKRGLYTPLQLQEVKPHVFKPVKGNVLFFKRDKKELKVAEGGRSGLRSKAVSSIIFIRHGGVRDSRPRTLTNIYEAVSTWHPVTLQLPDGGPKEIKKLLEDWETLYAERAVPFPAMQEVAAAFPSRDRVLEQLVNHRNRIAEILADPSHKTKGDALKEKIGDLKAQREEEKENLEKENGKARKERDPDKVKEIEAKLEEIKAKLNAENAAFDKIESEYNIHTNPDLVEDLRALLPREDG